eukprot:Gb_21147 [translate_table: standard]
MAPTCDSVWTRKKKYTPGNNLTEPLATATSPSRLILGVQSHSFSSNEIPPDGVGNPSAEGVQSRCRNIIEKTNGNSEMTGICHYRPGRFAVRTVGIFCKMAVKGWLRRHSICVVVVETTECCGAFRLSADGFREKRLLKRNQVQVSGNIFKIAMNLVRGERVAAFELEFLFVPEVNKANQSQCISVLLMAFIFGILTNGIECREVQALIGLRKAFTNQGALSDWLETDHSPCTWTGVKCAEGRVSSLDLSFLSLQGTISPTVGNLSLLKNLNLSYTGLTGKPPFQLWGLLNLEYLDLSNNVLYGFIPPEIGNLVNLREIVLNCNRFSGKLPLHLGRLKNLTKFSLSVNSFSGSIPSQLGDLQNLKYLDISSNSFSGKIPPEFGNLSRLLYLDASENFFSGIFPDEFGRLTSLLTLDLTNNALSGPIPKQIGSMINLTFLGIGSNSFNSEIPAEICNLVNLHTFVCRSCKFIGSFPPEIGNLYSLTSLDLSDNRFEGTLPGSIGRLSNLLYLVAANAGLSGRIPTTIGNCTKLQVMDLSFNEFSGTLPNEFAKLESIVSFIVEGNLLSGPLPSWLGKWRKANSIRLTKNQFEGHLPPELGNCSSLTTLSIDANRLYGPVPSELCNAKSLSHLSLSQNQFTGNIEETFRECMNLTDLVLDGNNLSGRIPGYLANLPLVTLEVAQNSFSGKVPDEIWGSQTLLGITLSNNFLVGGLSPYMANASSLERLLLDNNFFEGFIPKEIGQLRNLTNLSFHGNRLSGEIPPELFDCVNLVALDLGSNNLSGNIPSKIEQLSLLDNLVLSHNNLSGIIPGEICGGYKKVALPDSEFTQHYGVLDLSWNSLAGRIPGQIGDCTVVVELLLQGNLLTGHVPRRISQLVNLTLLDLSFNFLSGPIPPEVSRLQNLQGLILSHNQFTGTIPAELGRISGLVKLNLTRNRLRGSIPAALGNLTSLTHLGLSNNDLTGAVLPSSFANPGNPLMVLDLSSNKFTGSVPDTIANLSSLVILDVHNNDLIGSVPVELANLDSLTYLDMSCNHLNGSIPRNLCCILGLNFVNFSENELTGMIPRNCSNFSFSFLSNPGLCGRPTNILCPSAMYVPGSSLSRGAVWGITVGSTFTFLCLILVLLRWRMLRQEAWAKNPEKTKLTAPLEPSDFVIPKKMKEPLSINVAMFERPLLRLTVADMLTATNNFNKTNIIGDGGFGTVYKADLPEGRIVAVKKLGHGLTQGNREFRAEMETLGKVKHRNLVPLLGYCVFGEDKFLVYEYMENGSLDLWLRNRADALEVLDWPKRFKIAMGAARGLSFLHHGFIPHIIHRDMKSSNILLDASFEPKVADFGLARLISAYETHVSTDLAGTFGYIPPEYGQSWKATTRGDVYSYGVILLELLTGKEPTGMEFKEGEGGNLVGWVWHMIKTEQAEETLDPYISCGPWNSQMMQVLHLATLCTSEDPIKRPTMLDVVKLLKEIDRAERNTSLEVILSP